MPSIISKSYQLPLVEPLRKNKRFSSGANTPLLITGVEKDTGKKDDYVVKLIKAGRMYGAASMRELLAAFLAMEMGIPVTEPVIVNVSTEFVKLLSNDEDYAVAQQSIGYNYGSKYIDKYWTLAAHQPIPKALIPYALDVFAFDLFIQNSDRNNHKPNMITNGKEIVILDHEIAFGFVLDIPSVQNKTPWVLQERDKQWAVKHCLYNSLKGEIFDHGRLKNRLLGLDKAFWNRAWDLTPEAWRDKKEFDSIKLFLTQIVHNVDPFIVDLQRLLA